MYWRPVLIVLHLALLTFGKYDAEEKLLRKRNAQGNKCPYDLISITSLGHSEGTQQHSFWDQVKDAIRGLIWGRETSPLDHVEILSPDSISSSGGNDCRPVQEVQCDSSSPYRSHDGSCNNLEHPSWGMAGECQLRLLPAAYEGSDGFRLSVVGGLPLPEPRDLSVSILPDVDRPTPRLSAMFVYFGQFAAHDTMLTPTPTRNIVPCCPYDEENMARPECAPIFVRPDDPYYSRYNVTCLPFERTDPCPGCEGKMEKVNRETAFLDLSMVYGTSGNLSDALRLHDGTGRMNFQESDEHKMLPPRNINGFSNFCPPSEPEKCFLAGDDRVDQHSTLTSLHTLMLREHNRLVKELKEINPHWEGDTLYQETRKILGGQWQHMVYSEYLPLALGPRHMNHFGLWVGEVTGYNVTRRPGVWLEVTTAGFRLHSQVPSELGLQGIRFYETFLNPGLLREGCAENLVRGACRVPPQQFDRYFVEDVSGQFVRLPGRPSGLDTGAIDIQRGRDNGLPPYARMVHRLTGTKISTFESLAAFMTPDHIERLKENYASVDDVDLWLGLQLERHVPGSVLGFNTATLTALQFHFLKYGDRFYFEHRGEETSFTDAQLTSLRQGTFAKWLCDNMNLKSIQKWALLLPSYENPIVNCNEIPKMDLTPWKTDS